MFQQKGSPQNNNKKNQTLLISPLNWGLGHAVRDIPLINTAIKRGYRVVVAAEGLAGKLLKKEFPNIEHVTLKGFTVKYSKKGFSLFAFLLQIPKILIGIKREKKQLQKIIKEKKIDIIISDNRYGVFSKEVYSIFITHQISPKLPLKIKFLEKRLYKIHKRIIEKFNLCLIPDFESQNNLSGDLSHKYPIPKNARFTGILSQFYLPPEYAFEKKYDLLSIISGPEPQRSVFEKKILEQLDKIDLRSLVVTGVPGEVFENKIKNITIVNHLSRTEMQAAILSSDIVVCRSGYTSVMDLFALQKTAVFVPTPGQPEQEYLAEYLCEKGLFKSYSQNNFDLKKIIKEMSDFKPDFSKI